jgi:hypothetical protein
MRVGDLVFSPSKTQFFYTRCTDRKTRVFPLYGQDLEKPGLVGMVVPVPRSQVLWFRTINTCSLYYSSILGNEFIPLVIWNTQEGRLVNDGVILEEIYSSTILDDCINQFNIQLVDFNPCEGAELVRRATMLPASRELSSGGWCLVSMLLRMKISAPSLVNTFVFSISKPDYATSKN